MSSCTEVGLPRKFGEAARDQVRIGCRSLLAGKNEHNARRPPEVERPRSPAWLPLAARRHQSIAIRMATSAQRSSRRRLHSSSPMSGFTAGKHSSRMMLAASGTSTFRSS